MLIFDVLKHQVHEIVEPVSTLESGTPGEGLNGRK